MLATTRHTIEATAQTGEAHELASTARPIRATNPKPTASPRMRVAKASRPACLSISLFKSLDIRPQPFEELIDSSQGASRGTLRATSRNIGVMGSPLGCVENTISRSTYRTEKAIPKVMPRLFHFEPFNFRNEYSNSLAHTFPLVKPTAQPARSPVKK